MFGIITVGHVVYLIISKYPTAYCLGVPHLGHLCTLTHPISYCVLSGSATSVMPCTAYLFQHPTACCLTVLYAMWDTTISGDTI